MAGPYFVDDGASSPADGNAWSSGTYGDTWERAYTNLQALLASNTLASDEIVYIGADTSSTQYSGAWTITLPSANNGAIFISSTVGSGTTVSYAASTSNQIYASGTINFNGRVRMEGISVYSTGGHIQHSGNSRSVDCTYRLDGAYSVYLTNSTYAVNSYERCNFNFNSASTANAAFNCAGNNAGVRMVDCGFSNAAGRSGTVFTCATCALDVSGCDFSVFSNAGPCEILDYTTVGAQFAYCKLSSAQAANPATGAEKLHAFVNCYTEDAPEFVYAESFAGLCASTTGVYRSDGGSVEDITQVSWVMSSAARASFLPFASPWVYGVIASAGTKAFTAYFARDNSAAALLDSDIYLEVEVMSTADVGKWSLVSDWRGGDGATAGNILGNATAYNNLTSDTAQDTDGDSTWNNLTSPTRQKLVVSNVTVNEPGLFRARFVLSGASLSGIYCDPMVVVS